jgi:Circularly permutated YpsA SLOG family
MAEDGVIPERYPLIPLPKGGYRQRTRLNVSDSDGTAILYNEALKGGTRLTRNLCALLKKPYILVNARVTPDPIAAAEAILKFVDDNGIEVLNVAGPRASGWPAGYRFAADVLVCVLSKFARGEQHKAIPGRLISVGLLGHALDRCNHNAIDLRICSNVEHSASAIFEANFFIERNGPQVSLPYAKPKVFAIECVNGVIDCVHE